MRPTVICKGVTVVNQRRCVHFAFVFVLFAYTPFVHTRNLLSGLGSLPAWGSSHQRNESSVFKMLLIPDLITVYQHIPSERRMRPKSLVRDGTCRDERVGLESG